MKPSRNRASRIHLALLGSSAAAAVVLVGGQAGQSTASDIAAPVAAPADSVQGVSAEVLRLTNKARGGCDNALRTNSKLTKAAQGHANDMAANDYFSHTSKDGRSWDERIRDAGYTKPGGENIARGFGSARQVVEAWLDSPAHRRNIKDCDFRHLGVGFNTDGDYWVQDFGY